MERRTRRSGEEITGEWWASERRQVKKDKGEMCMSRGELKRKGQNAGDYIERRTRSTRGTQENGGQVKEDKGDTSLK